MAVGASYSICSLLVGTWPCLFRDLPGAAPALYYVTPIRIVRIHFPSPLDVT